MTGRSAQALYTFVPISDGERAKAFYRDVLDLDLLEDTPFALVFKVPGGALRLAKTPDFTPHPFTIVGWVTPDISSDMDRLAEKGVTFERFEQLPQDEAGIWVVPDGTKICWFRDPDGNLLSLTQTG